MDKYTIFGNPVHHSLSPKIHGYFAKQTGHLISYEKVLAPRDEFEGYVKDFVTSGGKGFNVTSLLRLRLMTYLMSSQRMLGSLELSIQLKLKMESYMATTQMESGLLLIYVKTSSKLSKTRIFSF